jgi:DNA mismatch repair protein MutS2
METELDLHGMTVEEALLEVEKFLDHAFVRGRYRVKIIHGQGRGTLRSAIRQALTKHPLVDSFRFGDYGEGDYGVTVVYLAH